VEEPSRREHEETLFICTREPFLALEVPGMHGCHGWVVFGGVLDVFGVAEGRIWVEKVVATCGEGDPFAVRGECGDGGG